MRLATLAAAAAICAAGPAFAGEIERACNGSGQAAANRDLCACIQYVADMTLSGADQKRAARFFRDPEAAQNIRASGSVANELFWERYTTFGQAAETMCQG
jgi:hypothetical protein